MVNAEKVLGIAAAIVVSIVLLVVCVCWCVDVPFGHLLQPQLFGLSVHPSSRRTRLLDPVSNPPSSTPHPESSSNAWSTEQTLDWLATKRSSDPSSLACLPSTEPSVEQGVPRVTVANSPSPH